MRKSVGDTAARADSLREQIERLTTALTETEARLAELAATRKGVPRTGVARMARSIRR